MSVGYFRRTFSLTLTRTVRHGQEVNLVNTQAMITAITNVICVRKHEIYLSECSFGLLLYALQ